MGPTDQETLVDGCWRCRRVTHANHPTCRSCSAELLAETRAAGVWDYFDVFFEDAVRRQLEGEDVDPVHLLRQEQHRLALLENPINEAVAFNIMGIEKVENYRRKGWRKAITGYRSPNGKISGGFEPYASSIPGAWAVIRRLERLGYRVSLHRSTDLERWDATFEHVDGGTYHAIGETAPLAICRAALKAHGLGVQSDT